MPSMPGPRRRRRSWPSSEPTAAGQDRLSLDLAERLGGEIVNTDAMAVYRGMDIGTAKLPESERAASRTTSSTCSTSPSR
jgi:tRNA dimethylallyltransferase